MPVRRPRRPTRQPRSASGRFQPYSDAGDTGGLTFQEKLDRIEAAKRREAYAPPIDVPRPPPSQRTRRAYSADELFTGWPSPTGAPTTPYETAEDDQLSLFGDEDPWYQPTLGEPDNLPSPSSTEYYSPTKSINPGRPRTLQMSYDRGTDVLRVTYRDGGTYDYFGVPGPIWYRIRKVQSPGRFIDRNIKDQFEYERIAL